MSDIRLVGFQTAWGMQYVNPAHVTKVAFDGQFSLPVIYLSDGSKVPVSMPHLTLEGIGRLLVTGQEKP